MKLEHSTPGYRVVCVAAAIAFALSLAACGDQPPAEPAAATMPSTAGAATEKKMSAEPKAGVPTAGVKVGADAALSGRVRAAIDAAPGLNNMPMDVRAADGRVTLYGTADSDEQRRKAEQVAARVPGVKSVKNELLILRGS